MLCCLNLIFMTILVSVTYKTEKLKRVSYAARDQIAYDVSYLRRLVSEILRLKIVIITPSMAGQEMTEVFG